MNNINLIDVAKKVFEIEAKEISNLSKLLTKDFEDAINTISNSSGKLIVTGMGKSGIIGKKIAATLASTGTPSFFLHPGEAYHGDLGMIETCDVVLLISNSGETNEVLQLIPFLKSQGNSTISMSGNPESTLGKNTDFHLNISIEVEACPLQLAPTSSTTATLVMGDAIAVSLMKLKDFKDFHFAKFHPGGSLGKRLLTNVDSVMKKDNLPICSKDAHIKEIIHTITDGKSGLVVVSNGDGVIDGIITDGDIRRTMENHEDKFFSLTAKDIMSVNPNTIHHDQKLVVAGESMTSFKVNSLLVIDSNKKLVGIIHTYNLGV